MKLGCVCSAHYTDIYSRIMFCTVGGFRVRVWESCRTPRSFGYGDGGVAEFPEVLGIAARAYKTHRSSGRGQNVMYPCPGYCGAWSSEHIENSGYGYECPTGLTEVPGTGMKVLQKFQEFRVLWHGRTELPEVPGRYKNAVPVPRVFVALAYRTYINSGYGYGSRT